MSLKNRKKPPVDSAQQSPITWASMRKLLFLKREYEKTRDSRPKEVVYIKAFKGATLTRAELRVLLMNMRLP